MESTRLFPYDEVRKGQESMVRDVHEAVSNGRCLIAHAPTGLGKTAAALSPALDVAAEKGLTVFFLTSRHTQHQIALDTLRQMKSRHKISFVATDIVGKKHMCAQEGFEALHSGQFHDYCRALRESGQCRFYSNLRKGGELSGAAKAFVRELESEPTESARTVELGKGHGVCPYEAAAIASKQASVIIADYYYIFNPGIRDGFFKRTGKSVEDSIIIIDEGHNLPDRIRRMLTQSVTTQTVERAIREADANSGEEEQQFLKDFRAALIKLADGDESERIIGKEQLIEMVGCRDMEGVLEKMNIIAEGIREANKQSFMGAVAGFVEAWMQGDEEGYARILSKRQGYRGLNLSLSYQCLDPAIATRPIIGGARSVIMMSGTLKPTRMYREILGFPEDTVEREYGNPFPKKNRLSMIITAATTKFSRRSDEQYKKIADACLNSVSEVPGNAAIFFPSYEVMSQAYRHMYGKTGKPCFLERPDMTKEEKQKLLSGFKASFLKGGLLLAAIGGSYYEGIDLPGSMLNAVIIVGLPLTHPDLQTKKLIEYYDRKYGKGWDYGYVFPAFTKALQSAGRCIRSETDRGVLLPEGHEPENHIPIQGEHKGVLQQQSGWFKNL
ncbi:ATP-dependent DNA helicase [Candidatus Woesearchaeota archaeon]|nr:ATP-dependent DNA helicase [Candidatus Woesearchaeota archaeon]